MWMIFVTIGKIPIFRHYNHIDDLLSCENVSSENWIRLSTVTFHERPRTLHFLFCTFSAFGFIEIALIIHKIGVSHPDTKSIGESSLYLKWTRFSIPILSAKKVVIGRVLHREVYICNIMAKQQKLHSKVPFT